jgi:hypothetical protein
MPAVTYYSVCDGLQLLKCRTTTELCLQRMLYFRLERTFTIGYDTQEIFWITMYTNSLNNSVEKQATVTQKWIYAGNHLS